MTFTIDNIFLIGSILLFISIIASKTAGKTGLPVLVIFMGIGMLAGSEGIGGINFDDAKTAQLIGSISLAFILFSGGLSTKWKSIKPILAQGITFSTLGVFLTALIVGVASYLLLNFTIIEGMLLGAIVSSTDAAAVFSILRSKGLGLKGNLRPLMELESGSNDPMAYILTLIFTFLLSVQQFNYDDILLLLANHLITGSLIGFLLGKFAVYILNKAKLDYEGLYSVLAFALVIFTYSFTDFINANGFLAVYIAGIMIGNHSVIHKRSIIRFYDGIAWLMQIIIFLTLGLMINPSQIPAIMWKGLILSTVLIFLARPIAVFISSIPFKSNFKEKILLSWVGLRGAVPIVFATYPMIYGFPKSDMFFNIVFFIVISSVLIQGTTIAFIAKLLHLNEDESIKMQYPLEIELSDDVKSELIEINIPENCSAVGKSILQLDIPLTALIVLIKRKNKFVTPRGSTVLEGGDKMVIMTDNKNDIYFINSCLGIKK